MGSAAISAAAAIISSITLQYLASGQTRASELGSETLAWAVLPIFFKIAASFDIVTTLSKANRSSPRAVDAPDSLQWVIAASLASLGFFKAENGVLGIWLAISPFVLIAQRYPQTNPVYLSGAFDFSIQGLWNTANTDAVFTGILAVLANLVVTRWHLLDFGISAIPVAVIAMVVYLHFMCKPVRDSSSFPQLDDINQATVALSLKVVIAMLIALSLETIIITALEYSTGELIPTIVLGLAKAVSWFFISQTARHVSWYAAIATGTFSIMSTLDPFQQSSDSLALFNVFVACLVLAQIISMLPKQDTSKHILWIFSLLSLVPHLSSVSEVRDARLAAVNFSQLHTHPVESLIFVAQTDFGNLLQNQSQSLEAATREYRRRYEMEPPPGFDAWYEYAVSHQSPIIDDFDTIYNSISPFLKISGNEVKGAMSRLQTMSPKLRKDLWFCRFTAKDGKTKCTNPSRGSDRHNSLLFKKLLSGLHGVLPDVTFLVNHLDEPMVLVPPASVDGGHEISYADMAHIPTWNSITKFCTHQQAKAKDTKEKHVMANSSTSSSLLLPFVENVSSNMDLCQHPEYHTMHGLFMSPTSFSMVTGLAPILSVGSPSTMGDILFPSAAYIERAFQYDEASDMDWDSKLNNVYWAGSTTGGFAADDGWHCYQRQRFVSLAQNLEPRQQQHSYLREEGGVVALAKSSFLNSRLFDVSMTRVFQCEGRFCRDQKRFFRARQWADKNEAFRSKLVFDLDGNGISGRYYKLLASRSAPLKQTLFREWHDDRLRPWVHYIPVSQGMEELPELVTFLTSTEAGRRRAKEIADGGREWFSKAFREVDLGIYMYRLLLELARLQDPSREASP